MKKRKIIHILPVLPLKHFFNYTPEYFNSHFSSIEFERTDKYPYWVGFFRADHHVVAAQELKARYPEYEIECWRTYGPTIERVYKKEVDGIMHKVFPSKAFEIPQIGHYNWSEEMYDEIKKEAKENEILVNISTGHLWFHIKMLYRFRERNFPIICVHRSGGFKRFYYEKLSSIKKVIKPYYLIESEIEVKALNIADWYFSGSMVEAKYIKENDRIKNSCFYMDGIDFEMFKPAEDKMVLRKKLGLPLDKTIVIAVGNFRSKDYGYHRLVECYKEIKKKDDNIALLMIGGYKSEDVYQMGVDAGCIMVERVAKSKLLEFYQASDFSTNPFFNTIIIDYGGIGSSNIESLACGLPVVSGNIIHFPGTKDEFEQIGVPMRNEQQLIEGILYIKNNLGQYKRCRELAMKYFDINHTVKILADKYNELLNKYYN